MDPQAPSDAGAPFLSVITATFNRKEYLLQAMESVRDQGRDDVEHIVVDGGSTDGTLEWLEQQEEFEVRVITGPDQGVYDAWNKGLRAAQGEVIGFLNSDDVFAGGALDAVLKFYSERRDTLIVCGGAEFYEGEFRSQKLRRVIDDRSTKTLELSTVMRGLPIINARFFRREVFDRVGLFDTSYEVASDKEFLLRVWQERIINRSLDQIVYRYRRHRDSLTMAPEGMVTKGQREALQLSRSYMDRRHVPVQMRQEAHRWHALKTGSLMWVCLNRGDYRGAIHWVKVGWRCDILWPIRFLRAALHSRRAPWHDQRNARG